MPLLGLGGLGFNRGSCRRSWSSLRSRSWDSLRSRSWGSLCGRWRGSLRSRSWGRSRGSLRSNWGRSRSRSHSGVLQSCHDITDHLRSLRFVQPPPGSKVPGSASDVCRRGAPGVTFEPSSGDVLRRRGNTRPCSSPAPVGSLRSEMVKSHLPDLFDLSCIVQPVLRKPGC